ncbi:flavodoxin [Vibrio tritonius]|uniref:flavodoxin n=1 Tax=Vibrio tritonius TaxID=1435069 RepID=UPI0008385FE5|nr:flavodoxin [Vibrio tritonius]
MNDKQNITNSDEVSSGDMDLNRRSTMKKIASLIVAGLVTPTIFNSKTSHAAPIINGQLKVAVVYFSKTGNTQFLAQEISRLSGGTLIEVKTVEPYPENYRATTRKAKIEQEENARPEITMSGSIEDADYVFIGYPNWWGTLPMALFTYLEQVSTANKTIIPFCTHEGSQLGRGPRDIRRLCPSSTTLAGYAQRGGDLELVKSSRSVNALHQWLASVSV